MGPLNVALLVNGVCSNLKLNIVEEYQVCSCIAMLYLHRIVHRCCGTTRWATQ